MDNPEQLQSHDPVQRSSRFRWLAGALIILSIVAAVSIYAWYFKYNLCEVKAVEEASAFLVSQLNTYDGVYQVAATASRNARPHPVTVLQQIFVDTQEVGVPACMQTAKDELLNYMGNVISAFQAFIAAETDTTIRDLLVESDRHYSNFRTELEAVKECAPYCAPWD